MKEQLIISTCLLGVDCKYNGGNNKLPEGIIEKLADKYSLIPVCPECYGGLTTPRLPSERVGDRVLSSIGTDVTEQYERGAAAAVLLADITGARLALLKENSPSCGKGRIYDGTFTLTLTDGNGVTAEALMKKGIAVYGESEADSLL